MPQVAITDSFCLCFVNAECDRMLFVSKMEHRIFIAIEGENSSCSDISKVKASVSPQLHHVCFVLLLILPKIYKCY